jgi:hypothetical protein
MPQIIIAFLLLVHVVEGFAEVESGKEITSVERTEPGFVLSKENVFVGDSAKYVWLGGIKLLNFTCRQSRAEHLNCYIHGTRSNRYFSEVADFREYRQTVFTGFRERQRMHNSDLQGWSFARIFYLNRSKQRTSRFYISSKGHLFDSEPSSLVQAKGFFSNINGAFGGQSLCSGTLKGLPYKPEAQESDGSCKGGNTVQNFGNSYLPFPNALLILTPLLFVGVWLDSYGIDRGPVYLGFAGWLMMVASWTGIMISFFTWF